MEIEILDDLIVDTIVNGEKINELTTQQLRNSRVETTVSGAITSEVTSVAALDAVCGIIDKHNLSFNVKNIWAINNQPNSSQCGISVSKELSEHFINTQGSRPGDVRAMLFKRLFMMIDIKDNFSDKTSGNIVISYHQNGIEFAFGDNVHVCSNLCIYGGEVIRNYALFGNKSIPFTNMLQIVNHWVNTYEPRRLRNIDISEKLLQRSTNDAEIESFFGDLVLRSARHTNNRDVLAPLNMTQIYDTCKGVTKKALITQGTPSWNINNAWELYNLITEQHKVDTVDSSMILYQANSAFELMKQRFDIRSAEIPVYLS